MRKIITLFTLLFALLTGGISAQTIYNNGFEQLNYDGTLSNWGNVYLFNVWIDSTGSHTDSIVYDGPFYGPSSDSHSGSSALELRNAWDFTTNTGIAGVAAVDDDSVFSSWGTLNLIPTNATLFNPFAPVNFGFYYKFSPVNGDSAYAQIALWDSSGNQLAEGTLLITDPASTYTLAYANIDYTVPGFAAFYSLKISNFYSAIPGIRQPGFGTLLLADNLGFNFAGVSGINQFDNRNTVSIYPNPSTDEINIKINISEASVFRIQNVEGKILREGTLKPGINSLPIDGFEKGIYILHIVDGKSQKSFRFVAGE